jgi:hypothetical protein
MLHGGEFSVVASATLRRPVAIGACGRYRFAALTARQQNAIGRAA